MISRTGRDEYTHTHTIRREKTATRTKKKIQIIKKYNLIFRIKKKGRSRRVIQTAMGCSKKEGKAMLKLFCYALELLDGSA